MDDFLRHHLEILADFEHIIGYQFKNKTLLRQAITHKSFSNENPSLQLKDNETLEFLGDSILNFVISSKLFKKFPGNSEGKFSRLRSYLVSGDHLYKLARKIKIGDFLILGKGERKTGGNTKKNILVDAFEALIGAIYLDGGILKAQSFISKIFKEPFTQIEKKNLGIEDWKTQFQEYVATNNLGHFSYNTIKEEGPDHEKKFFVQLQLNGKAFSTGYGSSKKYAQQMAAKIAISKLKGKN